MGRSYWFECVKCGYRARVSGREDRGAHFVVQTVLCADCRELYDAVTRLQVPDGVAAERGLKGAGWRLARRPSAAKPISEPPGFAAVLNRLPPKGPRLEWVSFQIQCPISPHHRVQSWTEPNRCPRCGTHLEKSALPYRLWD